MPYITSDELAVLVRVAAERMGEKKPASPAATDLGEFDEAALDVLCDISPALSSEVAEELGANPGSVAWALVRLERLGYAVSENRGKGAGKEWNVTMAGRKAAITPNPAVWG